MTELALRPATYEDLLKVPDNLVAELIDGELFTSPRPGSRHARASAILAQGFSQSEDVLSKRGFLDKRIGPNFL